MWVVQLVVDPCHYIHTQSYIYTLLYPFLWSRDGCCSSAFKSPRHRCLHSVFPGNIRCCSGGSLKLCSWGNTSWDNHWLVWSAVQWASRGGWNWGCWRSSEGMQGEPRHTHVKDKFLELVLALSKLLRYTSWDLCVAWPREWTGTISWVPRPLQLLGTRSWRQRNKTKLPLSSRSLQVKSLLQMPWSCFLTARCSSSTAANTASMTGKDAITGLIGGPVKNTSVSLHTHYLTHLPASLMVPFV